MTKTEVEKALIKEQLNLAGKTVYVKRNSSYEERLRNLSDEIGDSIVISPVNSTTEELIKLVSEGKIPFTVCDENAAKMHKKYYRNIDVATPISFKQNLAWAVAKESHSLKNEIDKWLIDFKKTARFKVIYNRYFDNKSWDDIRMSDHFYLHSRKISSFDNHIKKYSDEINWDWRLMASLIYQESRFNPNATSWVGAFGLMQFMPGTAARFGISKTSKVDEQIKAGAEFINWLEDYFSDIPDSTERKKFVLAAYNVGPGHMKDAMRLAEKFDKNPYVWDNNVSEFLIKKVTSRVLQGFGGKVWVLSWKGSL